jgi:hypothetical protein
MSFSQKVLPDDREKCSYSEWEQRGYSLNNNDISWFNAVNSLIRPSGSGLYTRISIGYFT